MSTGITWDNKIIYLFFVIMIQTFRNIISERVVKLLNFIGDSRFPNSFAEFDVLPSKEIL